MYNVHESSLGEAPPAQSPSLWDSAANLISSTVAAGFNMYNRVTQIKQQKQQTAQLQQYARAVGYPQVGAVYPQAGMPGAYGQPGFAQPSMFDGMMLPLALGAGALMLILVLKKKK
jgi:hypothetical protein